MPETIVVDRRTARRFLVRRTGLGRAGNPPAASADPASAAATAATLAAVRSMEYIQVDPVQVVGRNHDLVLAARVPGYRSEVLDRLLYGERRLVEVMANQRSIVPAEDYPLFRLRFRRLEEKERPLLADLGPC